MEAARTELAVPDDELRHATRSASQIAL